MANTNLHAAKRAKNDEFYTQFADIEREVMAYPRDTFKGKTILLPADDPEWSNFTKFFATRFDYFGLRKIISTSYNPEGQGKVFTIEKDMTEDGRVNLDDIQWEYLAGDGDFRSDEVRALRDEADIIITNPPFSLFREFLAWIVEGGKQFLLIGSTNAITYKEVFPLIKDGKMWLGVGFANGNAFFASPDAESHKEYQPDTGLVKFRNVSWFTNLDHTKRHEPLMLMSTADNLRFGRPFKGKGKTAYDRYDNYDAIEVPFTKNIPSDYPGVMGVPISFLDKFCPEQFEIVGITENGDDAPVAAHRIAGHEKYDRPYVAGKRMYSRIFIKHINHTN